MTPSEIAAENVGLVLAAARRMARRDPRVEEGDLVGAGYVGLLAAARRWDPERGARLSTYAYPRIRGAMVDELRVRGPVPTKGRPLDWPEIDGVPLALPAPEERSRLEDLEEVDALLALAWPREAEAIRLVYLRGLSQPEAGAVMGVSHSRVSQLSTRGLERIRRRARKERA